MTNKLIIGSYTKGIYTGTFNEDTGEINNIQMSSNVEKATYLDASNEGIIYAAKKEGINSGVVSLKLKSNTLTIVDQKLSISPAPVHINLLNKRNLLFASNYDGGYCLIYKTDKIGRIKLTDTFKNTGSGILSQQSSSHVHFACLAPDNSLIILDLGTDQIFVFDFSISTGKISKLKSQFNTRPGFGPRKLVFAHNSNYAYVLGELASSIAVLKFDPATKMFNQEQLISTIPDNWNGSNGCGGLSLSNNGRYLYASNRGHNSISMYEVDQTTFHLQKNQTIASGGKFPRDFCLSENGHYLIAGNQTSNNLSVFSISPTTGKLSLIESNIELNEPVCVKII